ncbi:MAG: tRNA (adenosine(37)-N6)-threonylcarbamoyltransferase complex ATPase subunit type 1 TsaE [Thermodesulfobacteriota bacterium]|nr:tRNA (adenosine(37)-N6)-threonylcarbamoyltransferase complex ATPase subunit type 1 TsaE [Thermodesulfobacteriota bacterium]
MFNSRICSINDTNELSSEVSKIVKQGTILLLNGELGSGKTQFVRFLGNHLNVLDSISSPTFLILNIYESDKNFKIYHFDFYRVNSIEELEQIGFFEILNQRKGLIIVEWANRYKDLFLNETDRTIDIYFNFIKDNINQREISIKGSK